MVRYVEIPHRTVFGTVRAVNSAGSLRFTDHVRQHRLTMRQTAQSRVALRSNRQDADSERETASALFVRHRLAMLPNVIFEPQTSGGVYNPKSPKNSSMRYFNVSYHKNLLRLRAYCSPTSRLHVLQVERILGMPRQQVIRGGGRLESKSKGPGAGPGPSEVAYRNLPLSDDGRRGLALADARPAARDAQKSQHCCRC